MTGAADSTVAATVRRSVAALRIAIASGKGGTGKTTVATNLAYVASRKGRLVAYVDCDVEAPNGHIFLKPQLGPSRPVEPGSMPTDRFLTATTSPKLFVKPWVSISIKR